MKTMIKSIIAMAAAVAMAFGAWADTATVNGITWTYTISNGEASLGGDSLSLPAVPTYTSGAITIPSTLGGYRVTSIGSYAFFLCRRLTSVTIPNNVTSIGSSAFDECSGLTSVTMPGSVTNIGKRAFNGCSGLTDVTLPSSVTSIEGSVFYGCSGLTNVAISVGVTSIGWGAFYGCSGLTDVTLPSSVTSIEGSAFEGCSGLTSVTIPSSTTNVSYWAFDGCNELVAFDVVANNETYSDANGLLLTKDGKKLVLVPPGLTSVLIPGSVNDFSRLAYRSCNALDSICVASDNATYCGTNGLLLTKDGKELVLVPPSLSSVLIPTCVTRIGYGAFSDCSNLMSVTIPSSVTSIGYHAFYNCSGLTSVTIPDSVTSIGDYAFEDCSGLTSVTIPGSVTTVGFCAFRGCSGLTSATMLEGVTKIGQGVFDNCRNLVHVVIPESVTDIGGTAFCNCSSLTKITIPSEVTRIDDQTFFGCKSLTNVVIPAGVTVIGYQAFYWCDSLASITFLNVAKPQIYGDGLSGIPSSCVIKVPSNATGWGVDVPGLWNGLKIDYITPIVMFDGNGGTVPVDSFVTDNGAVTNALPIAERVGYSFAGWYLTSAGTVQFDSSETLSGSVRVYAKWTPNSYTVNFNANGGTVNVVSRQATYASAYGELPQPTRAGYSFVGWMLNGAFVTSETVVSVADNHALVAQWRINQYIVSFNSAGGTAVSSITQDYETAIAQPANPTE